MELILSLKSQTVKSVKSLVSVSNSYYRYFLAEWIHRVGENTSGIRVGTMRTVTACYRLVAHRILPRQVPVARHFKVVVPGGREDNQASPATAVSNIFSPTRIKHKTS